jgi:hypothetical protein
MFPLSFVPRLKQEIVYREELGTTVVSTDRWPLLVDCVFLVAEIHSDIRAENIENTLPERDPLTVSDQ